jgi:hypothetical protein
MRLDINTNEVVRFTAKLESLRKSALPNAIRGTLNDGAFDVKQKTMPAEAGAKFIKRSPNFFKANSSVAKAVGMEVNTMKSTVGFMEDRLRLGSNNFSVRDLEQQEHSGRIGGKSFIPLDSARTGGYNTLVKPANRLSRILKSNKIVVARNMGPGSKKQQFIKAVHKAGAGGYVLGSNIKGETILWRVDSINGPNRFSLTALYDYVGGRKVRVNETGFMEISSMKSARKLNRFYIAQANFWINKYKK